VFKGFGCTGSNVSPALSWSGAPSGTKSFAVSMYDPDAPTGSGWWHWVVFNIPPGTTSLPKGGRRGEEEADAQGRDPEPH
jgi:Raf kinase inhibitor-like YbhB/YbcL family protein